MKLVPLSELSRVTCECQSTLVEPRSRHSYEQRQEMVQSDGDWEHGFSGVPEHLKPPTTADGTMVIKENFPDADFVCPECGNEWSAMVTLQRIGANPDTKI